MANGRLPVHSPRSVLDLAQDRLDDAFLEVVLARDVVVERHRLHAELLPEAAHAQRLEPALVGHLDSRTKNPLPGQRGPGLGDLVCGVAIVVSGACA